MAYHNETRAVRARMRFSLSAVLCATVFLAISTLFFRETVVRVNYVPITVKRTETVDLLQAVHSRLVDEFGSAQGIDLDELRGWRYSCPLVEFLSKGRVKSPLIVVYEYKLRGFTEWRNTTLNDAAIPLVFVSQSVGHSDLLGYGPVCYGDGRVRIEKLPIYTGSLELLDDDLVEVHGIRTTQELIYTDEVEAFRGVLLGRSELRLSD